MFISKDKKRVLELDICAMRVHMEDLECRLQALYECLGASYQVIPSQGVAVMEPQQGQKKK